jgi:hypothetical protein
VSWSACGDGASFGLLWVREGGGDSKASARFWGHGAFCDSAASLGLGGPSPSLASSFGTHPHHLSLLAAPPSTA